MRERGSRAGGVSTKQTDGCGSSVGGETGGGPYSQGGMHLRSPLMHAPPPRQPLPLNWTRMEVYAKIVAKGCQDLFGSQGSSSVACCYPLPHPTLEQQPPLAPGRDAWVRTLVNPPPQKINYHDDDKLR